MSKQLSSIQIAEHLHSFLYFSNQLSIENVCKSAIYLLINIPASRQAAIEHISTFYDIATIYNLNYIINQKSGQNRDLTAELNQTNQLNQLIDTIEAELTDLLTTTDNKDIWSAEISQWLINVLAQITRTHTKKILQITSGSSSVDETSALNLVDSLQIWTTQCKPTQSILQLLHKCFSLTPSAAALKSNIFDMLLNASSKTSHFDWVLCELGALNPHLMLKKCFDLGIKESRSLSSPEKQQQQSQQPLKRTSAINFYSLNYSLVVKRIVKCYLDEIRAKNDKQHAKVILTYLLQVAAQAPALLNFLLNDILSENYELLEIVWPYLIENDQTIVSLLTNCVRQLNNSVAVFDLISSIIKWLHDPERFENRQDFNIIKNILNKSIDDLIESVYLSYSADKSEKQTLKPTSDTIMFLKNLNSISSSSFRLLLDQIVTYLQADNNDAYDTKSLLFNLLLLIGINGNSYCANEIMAEFLQMKLSGLNESGSLTETTYLMKFRQEINPFYTNCFRDTVHSLVKSFLNYPNEERLKCFIENLLTIYGWDLANPNFMSENVSKILIEKVCFSSLISQLKIHNSSASNYSILIIELYNRLLSSKEPDLPPLKLSVEDALKCGIKLINHFYDLCFSLNEENMDDVITELNELNDLIKNTCKHLSHNYNENSPYRNTLLRTLIDKLFEMLKNPKFHVALNIYENLNGDTIDENSNLFTSNLNLINNEMMLTKSKLKAVRSTLNEPPTKKLALKKSQLLETNKTIMNFALLDLLDTICSKSQEEEDQDKIEIDESHLDAVSSEVVRTDLLSEQMSNLAELLLQHILLDQYFVDYQWPSSPLGDGDENNESEVEAIKMFIERDVAVQNMVENSNNRRIIWQILDFLALDEQSFNICAPIIRSLLASQIIQWESVQDQPSRNSPKTYEITIKLLNLLNRPANLMAEPLCFIVDIIPLLSSYETHILLLMIWRYLKAKMHQPLKPNISSGSLNLIKQVGVSGSGVDIKQLRFIFQKNICKLAPFYAKFFQKKQSAQIPIITL